MSVKVRDLVFGGEELVVMAGPCAVESRAQIFGVAERVAASGAKMLRGGAFKTRTAPGSFTGLGDDGVRLLREAADSQGLLTVSEVQVPEQIDACRPYIDLFQVGSRNMQHIPLLQALGRAGVPVLLKRGLASTIDEWVNAAAYIRQEGNDAVILCERGIRTFVIDTRFTLDVAAVPSPRSGPAPRSSSTPPTPRATRAGSLPSPWRASRRALMACSWRSTTPRTRPARMAPSP
jgi:3-deoxy-7-phosphoheptulonate synthase